MHPEIEAGLREYARNFLATDLTDRSVYTKAAERGDISFDDVYFIGIVNGAQSIIEGGRVETGSAPVKKTGGVAFVVSDDPDFRREVVDESYRLVAEIYDCKPEEAAERFIGLLRKITDSHNRQFLEEDRND